VRDHGGRRAAPDGLWTQPGGTGGPGDFTLGQLHVLLGGAPEINAIRNIVELPRQLLDMHYPATVIGLAVIALVLIWPRLPHPLPHIPAPLVAVVATTALAAMLALNVERVVLPGSLLDSLGLPEMPGGMWGGVLTGVFTVALIASVESLLSAVAVDKLSAGKPTNFDRELVGQGVANTVSGMLGGLPVTGVIVRSSANVAAGARTRASAVLHGVWVIMFVVLFIELIELIPLAVLAGLLVVIGMRLVKLAHLRSARRQGELTIYLVTMASVVGAYTHTRCARHQMMRRPAGTWWWRAPSASCPCRGCPGCWRRCRAVATS
jgi:carbonic anhydrase